MKILYLLPFFKPYVVGGAEVSTSLYLEKLRKKHRMVVVTPHYGSWRKKVENEGGSVIYRFPFPVRFKQGVTAYMENILFTFYLFFWMIFLVKKYRIDIIHIQNDMFIPSGGLASLILRKPYFVTVRDHGFYPRIMWGVHSWLRNYAKGSTRGIRYLYPFIGMVLALNFTLRLILYKRATRLVGVSKYMAHRATRDLCLPSEKGVVVYNLLPPAQEMKKVKEVKDSLLYVGRLDELKGIDLLLKSMQSVVREYPGVKLWLAGNGNMKPYKELVRKLRMSSHIIFLGQLSYKEVVTYYAKASVIIIPSVRHEPLSRVLIEAGSLGRPIIATNTGGSSEVIQQGKTGLLVGSNSDDMTRAILSALRNPAKRKSYGKNLSAVVKELFAPERNVAKLERLYENALR